jgi:nitrite reductase/ring-hydroxylating ferredoxin subunit
MPDDTQLTALCAAVDADDDTPVCVESRGTTFAIFRVDGRYYVAQAPCTVPLRVWEAHILGR